MRWVTWADPQNGEGSKRLKLRALFIQSSFEECFSVRIFIHQPFHGALNRKPPNFSSDPWLKFDIPHTLIVLCFVLVQSTLQIYYICLYKGFLVMFIQSRALNFAILRKKNRKYPCIQKKFNRICVIFSVITEFDGARIEFFGFVAIRKLRLTINCLKRQILYSFYHSDAFGALWALTFCYYAEEKYLDPVAFSPFERYLFSSCLSRMKSTVFACLIKKITFYVRMILRHPTIDVAMMIYPFS